MMKASVRHRYGPPEVLGVEEIQKPTPRQDEILIKVHAASANLGDWELLTGQPFYIAAMAQVLGPKPPHPVVPLDAEAADRRKGGFIEPKYKIMGCDVAGEVEAVGEGVTKFRPGDEIFGLCSLGTFAQYVCVPETVPMVRKPPTLTFEQASALPQAAFIALQGLRDKGRVQPGHKVLITGAGGGAGTVAVQYAKYLGAEVTGIDNGKKLDLMRSIGADHVFDYTCEDFTRGEQRYDVILDLVAQRSVFAGRRCLRPGGVYVVGGGVMGPVFQSMLLGPLLSKLGDRTVTFLMADSTTEDLDVIIDLFEAGRVVPVIDRSFSLSKVPEALRHMGEGHALGKVIITPWKDEVE